MEQLNVAVWLKGLCYVTSFILNHKVQIGMDVTLKYTDACAYISCCCLDRSDSLGFWKDVVASGVL